ncbi:MAG: DNA-binding response regulator [Candidatus Nitrospira kreftii]|uniref:DNA-binding response regulator n=1 Tax=Candidatus Nitrospira kreftii TaxID=2652173 RepID=A0A7S8J0S6_9BACT|nr:MAG: DNA-binding response regulator [Candidatus Nitrospira kreftii]
MSKPHILLADDHPQMLANLCRLADKAGEVVGAVTDGRAAVDASRRLHPDVVVLDLVMPRVGGLDAARAIRRDLPDCRVVVCTVHANENTRDEAFAAGAVGFVRKQSAHSDLVPAIHAAWAGETFVSPLLEHNTAPPQKNGDSG